MGERGESGKNAASTSLRGRSFSLRVRLLLLGVLTLLPAFGFIFYSTFEQRQQAVARAKQDARHLLQFAALDQKQMVVGVREQLLTLAQLPIVRDPALADRCHSTFARLREQHRHYGNLGVADLQGRLRCSAAPLKTPVNIADRDYFREALATRGFSVSNYQIGRVIGRSVVTFGYPVLDDRGAAQGVVFVSVDILSWFKDMIAAISLPPNATLLLVNDRGTIFARHPDPEAWMGKTLPDSPLVKAILAQRAADSIDEAGVDGVRRLHVFAPINTSPTARVYLVAGIPTAEVLADVNRAFLGWLAGISLVAAIVAAAAWLGGSRLILSPVLTLTAAAQRLGEGDLRARTRLPHTADELGRLAHSFDTMAAALEQRVAQLHAAQDELLRLNEGLERRVAERTAELDATNKELEAFSYSVSHDLRAPLRSIDGFSQALLEDYADRLDDAGRQHLARVRAATVRMGELIDDLLQLSRVTRAEMRRETVDLSALAETVVANLKRAEPQRSVELNIQPGLRAEGDSKLLRIALVNLLSNAWKFTGRNPVAHIEMGRRDAVGEHAFYVRDDGAGFDMAYADKLFGAFQRLHAASEFPGTGIGLAIVQRIIARHGGRVWAEGSVNQGATFYFALPPTRST